MALDHHIGSLAVDRLGPTDLVETFGFLDRDPVLNVYLLALTVRDTLSLARDEFWAVRREGEIVALLYLGAQSGAVLPVGEDAAALRMLADQARRRASILPRRFQVIGRRCAVTAVTDGFKRIGLRSRLFRSQQYLSLARGALTPFERLTALRPATPDDYDLVYQSGALLRAEELEEDPRSVDPIAYAKRVDEECRDGYTHLWLDRDGLCFRASVSAVTADATQVSGVYAPPERRNQGFARRGLSELCARLFERSATICLFVNDFNTPALALYRRMGFTIRSEWASAFYDTRPAIESIPRTQLPHA